MIKELLSKAGKKMRTVVKQEYGMKEYIKKGFLNEDEIREIMKLRLHMGNMRCNYKSAYENNQCQFCKLEEETTEHILLRCHSIEYLRADCRIKGNMLESTDAEDIKTLLRVSKLIDLLKIQ